MNCSAWKRKAKKGFTLIEVLVVIAIIGIAASIAVPNITNYIKRVQVRDNVSKAELARDTILTMASLQYAKTKTGNPYIGSPESDPGAAWSTGYYINEKNADGSDLPPEYGDQYIYADSQVYTVSGSSDNYVRFTLANLAAPDANRKSEGILEFEKRTLLGTPHNPWAATDGFATGTSCEDQICYELYVKQSDSNVPINGTYEQIPNGEYFNGENIAFGRFYFPEIDKTNDSSVSGTLVTYNININDVISDTGVWYVYKRTADGWELLGDRAG